MYMEEASTEKAGVGGSIPSLATIFIICMLLRAAMHVLHLALAFHNRLICAD